LWTATFPAENTNTVPSVKAKTLIDEIARFAEKWLAEPFEEEI